MLLHMEGSQWTKLKKFFCRKDSFLTDPHWQLLCVSQGMKHTLQALIDTANVLSMLMLWCLWECVVSMRRRGYLHFFIVCLYIYCRWRYNHQKERVGISLTGWTPSHVYACSKPEPGFLLLLPVKFIPQCIIEPCHMSWYLLCSVKIRGDCSFFF